MYARMHPIEQNASERHDLREGIETFGVLADCYGISVQQYVSISTFEGIRTPNLMTELRPAQKVAGVLRAIGGGYLTPRFEVHREMVAKWKDYHKKGAIS